LSDDFSKEAARSVSKAVGALLSSPASEFSELVADQIRYYRWRSLVRIAERAREIRLEKGISQEEVPLKMLLPILEEGSKESEESDICENWAQLLANASSDYNSFDLACIEFLKRITSDEAKIIDDIGRFSGIDVFLEVLIRKSRESGSDWLLRMEQLPEPERHYSDLELPEADRVEFKEFLIDALEADLRHCWRTASYRNYGENSGKGIIENLLVKEKHDVFVTLQTLGLLEPAQIYQFFPDFSVSFGGRGGWGKNGKWRGSGETVYVHPFKLTEIGHAFWEKVRSPSLGVA
jgi:transcriptional regulator with XRE-family HTH domain